MTKKTPNHYKEMMAEQKRKKEREEEERLAREEADAADAAEERRQKTGQLASALVDFAENVVNHCQNDNRNRVMVAAESLSEKLYDIFKEK